jgi:antitoxin component of MazEF toxin-antitoxin module
MLIKKIVKRGSSKFVLLPKDLLDMLNLELDDFVYLEVKEKSIVITPLKKIKDNKKNM